MKLLITFILLSGVCFGQSKKDQIEALNKSIDSLNTVLSTARDKSSKDIGRLNTTIDGLNSEITQLKNDVSSLESSTTKLTKEVDKLKFDLEEMSKKNLELEVKLKDMKENNWVISNSTPFLNSGLWIGDCAEERSVETPSVEFWDRYMIFGVEGAFGGTVQNIFYNSYSKKFKIIYVNNNDMAGDGTIYEFILSYEEKGGSRSLIFQEEMLTPDYNYGSNEILTYHFCD